MQKTISIICPCYNEEENVEDCYKALCKVFKNNLSEYNLEIIFADNNSSDETGKKLENIASQDKRVKVIFNARNYGVHASCFFALTLSSGDAVVPMFPVDLQDSIDLIPQFVRKWEEGFLIVCGARRERNEAYFLKTIRNLYYRIFSYCSSYKIPSYVGEYQLIDKSVREELKKYQDYFPLMRALIPSVCQKNTFKIDYKWEKRKKGKSKYNFFLLYEDGINGIIFTTKSLVRSMMLFSAGSMLINILMIPLNLLFKFPLSFLDHVYLCLFSIILLFISVLGEYICAIHSQVRKGPLVSVYKKINF